MSLYNSRDESATALAASATHTGTWIDARDGDKVIAVAKGASLNVTCILDLDYDGDGTAEESVTATAGVTSLVASRDLLARQVRIRITNNGASAQNVSGTLLVGKN